nr:DUF5312 domain-containing protein [Treponemataceae bacterium]
MKSDMGADSSFDRLVMGLSNQERIKLLEKMRQISSSEKQNIGNLIEPQEKDEDHDLNLKLSKESLLLRIWLKIKSIFTSISVDYIYNRYLLTNLYREVQLQNPDIIDFKNGYFLHFFYEELAELKRVQDYFKTGISIYEENQGEFYVFMGSLIFQDLEEKLKKDANPYNYSFDDEITSDMRNTLVRHMDENLHNLPLKEKSRMYGAVQGLEWLRQFTKVPIERMINKFAPNSKGLMMCQMDAITNELAELCKVMSNCMEIYTEVLEALYLFTFNISGKEKDGKEKQKSSNMTNSDIDSLDGMEEDMNQSAMNTDCASWTEKSVSQISIIRSFITSVPLKKICRLSMNSSI